MFITAPFQPTEIYSADKLSYKALFDMTGVFSEQARRGLNGDDELAAQLFSEQFSCHPQVVPLLSSSSPSPSASLPAAPAAAANYLYQPVFFESGYYQSPSYMPGYFDSASVSSVYSTHLQQQLAMQRYTSTPPPISTSSSASPSPSAAETDPTPSPLYQTVPRLTQYPRPRHAHHYYQQQIAAQQKRNTLLVRSSCPDLLSDCGVRSANGTWRCSHPGCSSKTVFTRACDLRKHYNRHRKHLFCRFEGCPQSREGGFSSKKDRVRHEAKHNPQITCEWPGCGRVFSRADNMKDHVRRIHCRRR